MTFRKCVKLISLIKCLVDLIQCQQKVLTTAKLKPKLTATKLQR